MRKEALLSISMLLIILSLAVITVYQQPAAVKEIHLPKVVVRQINQIVSTYYQYVINNISVGNFTLALQMVFKAPSQYSQLNSNLSALIFYLQSLLNSTSLSLKEYYLLKTNESLNQLKNLLKFYSLNVTLTPIYSLLTKIYIGILQQESKLIKTKIEINVTNSTVPGGNITITGKLLTYNGTPLPFYTVYITLLNKQYSVITNSIGSFELNLTLPQIYVREIEVTVYFLPTNVYAGSLTTAKVFLNYYQPEIQASLNQTRGFEGEKLTLNFELKTISTDNTVIISIFNSSYTITDVEPNVTYSTIITLPTIPGLQNITVTSLPQGNIAPASVKLTVNVTYFPANITFESPGFIIAGLPTNIHGYTTPKFNGEVLVMIGNNKYYTHVIDGQFSVSVVIPPTLNLGNTPISVSALPPYSGTTVKSVYVINVLDLVPLGVVGYLAYYALSSRTVEVKREEKKKEGVGERKKFIFTDPIALAYYQALTAIEKITNEEVRDYYTVREYLNLVRGKIDENKYNAFSRLTFLFELRVYGNHALDLAEVNELLKVIMS
ncbi:hypothetical protein [Saccharolobus islandicus]|uniref:DUF4129 domain-containing protein n=1 Tax=Saccharolobus islandicus LAL14/1 TaxID=1241935 RepID=M9U867_SACIS|nr:hypothetical protein [Sulfolobus islandicus]AGJ62283.1 Hypothetical Protein SiL_0828 [Sulfolobus islandicus LAL14/1]